MFALKFRLVSALAAATVVLGAAAGLAAGTGTVAPDRGAATLAGQEPATSAATAAHTAGTATANTGSGHHNADTDDMGWQW
ncbi:hypothetical protein [Kitasatospora sp. A2-31]|uniref:hypothetical protein n=1 Tax=Kitasatospora sp. A2-31 TaxID=2916414 RepID=UPI001EE9E044|nr:hypothetical protein [Kitasatospora sp. A2-31]MCG6498008.1 hypothetical protein [Kitasatospora sp. A2-31]